MPSVRPSFLAKTAALAVFALLLPLPAATPQQAPQQAQATFSASITNSVYDSNQNPGSCDMAAISAKLLQVYSPPSTQAGAQLGVTPLATVHKLGTIARTLSVVILGTSETITNFMTPANGPFTITLGSMNADGFPLSGSNQITLTNCVLMPGQTFLDDKHVTQTLTFGYDSVAFSGGKSF